MIMPNQRSRGRIPAQSKAHQCESVWKIWQIGQELGFWTPGFEYLCKGRGRAGK